MAKYLVLKDCGIAKAGKTIELDPKDAAELLRVEAIEPVKMDADKATKAKG